MYLTNIYEMLRWMNPLQSCGVAYIDAKSNKQMLYDGYHHIFYLLRFELYLQI